MRKYLHGARISLYGILATAVLTFGCSHSVPKDQTIVTDIQAKLYADPITKPASIAVTAQNGAVTLSGNVDSSDVALEAMKIANGTPGVKGVNDGLTINGASASAQLPNAGGTAPAPPATGQMASNTPPPSPPVAPPQNLPPSAPPSQAAAQAPPPQPAFITIPAGERIQVRTIDAISTATDSAGQVFRASLDAPLVHNGRVIIPAGAPVSLEVVAAKSAGRVKGQAELEVRASRIEYHGHSYHINSSVFEEQGKGRGKQTAVRTGIGAVAGGVIGAIAGGGKGAAIGSAAGGGAGFGSALFTHGQQVKIPSESVLTFRLEAPLRLER
jgi:hypothetical protein